MMTFEDMYRSDRPALLSEILRLLHDSGDHPGTIAVAAFLAKKGEILRLLTRVEVPFTTRLRLGKLAAQVDHNLHHSLASLILQTEEARLRQDLLEILSQTRVTPKVVSQLKPLLRDRDPHVQSKMAFLMAGVEPDGAWVAEGLTDPDPRMRANIIEALWRQKSEFAREVFRRSATDAHHRVAANAIFGLYLLGDAESLPMIRQLLGSSGLGRRAGLWLVEMTRDPRFLSQLGKLIGKVEPEARARCLRVIQAAKQRRQTAIDRGVVRVHWNERRPGLARFAAVTEPDGKHLTKLDPFDLVLQSEGQSVDTFEVRPRQPASERTVVLLTGECPNWRDSWAEALTAHSSGIAKFGFLPFSDTPSVDERVAPGSGTAAFRLLGVEVAKGVSAKDGQKPHRTSASTALINWCGNRVSSLRRALDHRPSILPTFTEAIRMAAASAPPGAELHLVVLDETAESGVQEAFESTGFELDVIAAKPSPSLAQRCQDRGGQCFVAKNVHQAAQHLVNLSFSWQADYDIAYPSGTVVDSIEIFSEWGYGVKRKEGSEGNREEGMVGVQGLEPRASSV